MKQPAFLARLILLYQQVVSLRGIRSVLRIQRNLSEKNVTLVAGGVAFYAFLSIFPGILCVLILWGLLASTDDVSALTAWLGSVLPGPAFEVVSNQLTRLTERDNRISGWAAMFSLFVALWSASRAVNALLAAIHMMYRAPYKSGVIRQRVVALGFTLSGIVFAIMSVLLIGAVPPVLEALRLGAAAESAVLAARWLFILAFFGLGAFAFYYVSRRAAVEMRRPRRNQVVPGTIAASCIWLLASFGFSFYLTAFARYNEMFGPLGAVAALLIWLWVSALALLIGAEINTDYEGKQTRALKRQEASETLIPPTE